MKEGDRLDLYGLTVTKRSHYPKRLRSGQEIEVWRYAFKSDKMVGGVFCAYVYSGLYLGAGIDVGCNVNLRATVKHLRDGYGFIRLQRLKPLPDREPELRL